MMDCKQVVPHPLSYIQLPLPPQIRRDPNLNLYFMQLINYQEKPPSEHFAANGTLYSCSTLLTKSHREQRQ